MDISRFPRRSVAALAVASSVGLFTVVATSSTPATAAAVEAWSRPMEVPARLLTLPDQLTVGSCLTQNLGVPAAATYTKTGASVGTIPATESTSCDHEDFGGGSVGPVVDQAGNIYIDAGGRRTIGTHKPYIYSFTKEGVARWAQPALLPSCSDGDYGTRWMSSWSIGADGNLYGIERGTVGSVAGECGLEGATPTIRLISFDSSTGNLRFNKPLPRDLTVASVFPYRDGLVVFQPDGIHYYNYDGSPVRIQPYRSPLGAQHYSPNHKSAGVTYDGRAAILTSTGLCADNRSYRLQVELYDLNGQGRDTQLSNCAISQDTSLHVAPDGGAVVYSHDSSTTGLANMVRSYDAGGSLRWSKAYYSIGELVDDGVVAGVDTLGNVVVRNQQPYDPQIGELVQIDVLDGATGSVKETVRSSDLPSFQNFTAFHGYSAVGLSNDRLYLGMLVGCKANAPSPCQASNAVYAVDVPGLTMDYPRGHLLGQTVEGRCHDAALIGVRGSGDNDHGSDYPGRHAIWAAERLQATGVRLYTTGTQFPALGVTYPAVGIREALVRYRTSQAAGASALAELIADIRLECGVSYPVFLVGFSQGAHVIQSTLERLDRAAGAGNDTWRSVRGAALVASPRFNPNDNLARGTFVRDYPQRGGLGAASLPSRFRNGARTYCLADDPVCAFSTDNFPGFSKSHSRAYNQDNTAGASILSDEVGRFLWSLNESRGPLASGGIDAFPVNINQRRTYFLSAAAIYSTGSPTVRFAWDFTNDGVVDVTTPKPWLTHDYSAQWPPAVPPGETRRVIASVRITQADGTVTRRTACLRLALRGAATC